jgi:hypothetical protein
MTAECRWDRVRMLMTPTSAKMLLMVVGLLAMVLGGAADERWS